VLVPYHGFYSWSAGKGTSLHIISLDDLLRARGNHLVANDPHFFDRLFAPLREGNHRPVIITDVPLTKSGPLWTALDSSYPLSGLIVALDPVDLSLLGYGDRGLPADPLIYAASLPRMLELFSRYRIQATFFSVGRDAERHQGVVRAIAAAGHEVASHSFSHPF